MSYLYSVVIPVYNSAKTLPELCSRIKLTFEEQNHTFEIICVNDCSTDSSWEVLRQLKKEYGEQLVAVHLRKNSGQHKALLCGFQFAKGEYVVTLDDDLQFFPEDISVLMKAAEKSGADLVYGTYQNAERKHPVIRKWGSGFVAYMFEKFGNTTGQGSSFKLIHRSLIEKIKDYSHSFTFLDEILSWHTRNTEWVEVRHTERREGESGYSVIKLVLLSLNLIFTYTTIPLRFMTWFGLTSFVVCLFFVGGFIYQKIVYGTPPVGFTALIVSIFMSTGIILFSLGIIGEYMNRLFALQHKKPSYQIKEVLR
jgi:glycosyltransferase involved in cell wall biosynthesis